jgi:hypothetical protein
MGQLARVDYPITSRQLLAAFQAAILCNDGCIYVQLPTLTLDAPLPPLRFPATLPLEDAWRITIESTLPRIWAGIEREIYHLNPTPPKPGDTTH